MVRVGEGPATDYRLKTGPGCVVMALPLLQTASVPSHSRTLRQGSELSLWDLFAPLAAIPLLGLFVCDVSQLFLYGRVVPIC